MKLSPFNPVSFGLGLILSATIFAFTDIEWMKMRITSLATFSAGVLLIIGFAVYESRKKEP